MNIEPLRVELDHAAEATRVARGDDGRPWVLFGSMAMWLHGLRDRVGDVDVFASHRLWEQLAESWRVRAPHPTDPPYLERLVNGVVVNVFYTWTVRDPEVDARECRRAAELVGGWWCTPLQVIRQHKQKGVSHPDPRYAKHRHDIAILDQHLATQVVAHARTTERQGREARGPELGAEPVERGSSTVRRSS